MVRGDVGTAIDCNMRIDVSTATLRQIKYRKPSGATGLWPATVQGTQILRYITLAASDVDEAGAWQFQPYVEKADGRKVHGRMQTVVVEDHL